jgi:hypothetical protein
MDAWAWSAIDPWLADRLKLPVGALFCVIDGPIRGRAWSPSAARAEMRQLALKAGVRRRFAPHQLRHAHAVELLHEGRVAGDSAPARALALVNDRHVSGGDQPRGDHFDRALQAGADDARQRRPRPVAGIRGSAVALPRPWAAALKPSGRLTSAMLVAQRESGDRRWAYHSQTASKS